MKFKLESVLKLKKNVEEVAKRELGIANYNKQVLVQQKDALIENKIQVINDTKSTIKENINIVELKNLNSYSKYIEQKIESINKEVEQADNLIELKKKEVAEAMKQRKAIEKLKEIQYEIFLEEEKQRELNLLDEIVSYKYTMKEKEE